MSILTVRTALKDAGIAAAATATMKLGPGETQIYTVGGVEIVRPAGKSSEASAKAIVAELSA